MKYVHSIEIDQPLDKVIELFDNPDNMAKWQPGFISFTHLSGTPGQPGAQSRIHYKMGKRKVDMIETILTRDLPREFSGTYETPGVRNFINNTFEVLDKNRTRWTSENEVRFSGLMKIFGFFMRGAFPKQSYQFMENFKEFAESE
ncbi:MAG: SRPBCC family protein [Bacteroidota bacterium]